MRLSVIIPVYNVEEYVLRCLKSIIDIENHGDTEIIVVNDGSRDGSMALVSDFASSHPIITIVNQENRGLGAARNTGLKHAQGEYVYFLDSDDYIDLESFVHLFNTGYGSADVIVGNFVYNTDDVIEKSKFRIPTDKVIVEKGRDFFVKYYRRYISTTVWRSIYRRKLLIENDLTFAEGVYHEDVNWTPNVLLHAGTVIYCPLYFYNYIIRNGSIINSALSERRLHDILFVYEDLVKNAYMYDNPVQKELSFITIVGLFVYIGRYWGKVDEEKLKQDVLRIMSYQCRHYWYIYLGCCLFKLFPNFMALLLKKRYS
jgi:glycosyltransferase involved in cell wall biosynthesis